MTLIPSKVGWTSDMRPGLWPCSALTILKYVWLVLIFKQGFEFHLKVMLPLQVKAQLWLGEVSELVSSSTLPHMLQVATQSFLCNQLWWFDFFDFAFVLNFDFFDRPEEHQDKMSVAYVQVDFLTAEELHNACETRPKVWLLLCIHIIYKCGNTCYIYVDGWIGWVIPIWCLQLIAVGKNRIYS